MRQDVPFTFVTTRPRAVVVNEDFRDYRLGARGYSLCDAWFPISDRADDGPLQEHDPEKTRLFGEFSTRYSDRPGIEHEIERPFRI
jgi:hypothetical protein